MTHRILKTALINDEIDMTINAIEYLLDHALFMSPDKKSKYGRLRAKLRHQAEKLPKKIEVISK